MYGCKDKLCLEAEEKLVQSNRPKMLKAYGRKLSKTAERLIINAGLHQMLKQYRFEFDEELQVELVLTGRPKLLAAYGHKLCFTAENVLRKMDNPRLNRAYKHW